MELNPSQIKVVQNIDGPLMVLAGAGSGKTRTIVARIVNLIENKNISPYRILALTFSNKASKEMRDRISYAISSDIKTLQVTTFHSFCARLLRNEAKYLGLSKTFSIYDDGESRILIKNILSRFGISQKDVSPYELLDYINKIKNGSLTLDDDADVTNLQQFKDIYFEYEKNLRQSNAIDFGGLISLTIELFKNFPEILLRYQQRFEYILVDEYQDTNHAQFELIYLLSSLKKNICVVGDEDQSIYSWRGADINNILNFEKKFNNAKIIKLEQNYRSSKNIIEAASKVIENNNDRKGKKLWTSNDKGKEIQVIELANDKEEAKYVVDEIVKLKNENVDLTEISVFYRTNAQSRLIEDHLRRFDIPYKIIGSVRFYDRKEIKDLLCYMRLLVNEDDSLAVSRVINTPTRGIGAVTFKKLESYALENEISLYACLSCLVEKDNNLKIRTTKKMLSELERFISLVEEAKNMLRSDSKLSEVYEYILFNSGYYEWLNSQKTVESKMRLENLDELSNAINQYSIDYPDKGLDDFLESITLNEQSEGDASGGFVSLMTIHGSKGLEFFHVFLTGLEENIFPSYRSVEGDGIEEERRLFYVAMTRAMKTLTISYSQARVQFGQLQFNPPSRFIDELPREYCNFTKIRNDSFDSDTNDFNQEQIVYQESSITIEKQLSKYKVNQKIEHNLYGNGLIVDVLGNFGDEKIVIKFKDGSVKKFMAKFAPITIL